MADVTISSLPLGTPSGNALLPYSQGGQTLAVAPSGIIAAGVTPGTILQTIYGEDDFEYYFPNPGNNAPINPTSTISINLKFSNSKVLINTAVYGAGFRGSIYPGWGLWLLYQGNNIVKRQPYCYVSDPSVVFVAGTLSTIGQHSPGIINPTYRLAIQKASVGGTTDIYQYSAYWTIQEIAQ